MADSVLTNYTQSGPVVANGTVGTTINSIVIRAPADQRAALNVYSIDQTNTLFLPVSTTPGSSATMAASINMSGNAIANVKAPVAATDAANKAYVDSTTVSLAGDTMTGPLQMNNNAVTGLPVPQNATDAASKNYVDAKFMVAAGPNSVTGIMQMNGNIVAGLPAPQNAGDAANKNYVDTTKVARAGDTMIGALHMSGNRITDLPTAPAAATDAVNKTYVDTAVAAGVASVSSGPGYLQLTGTGNSMMAGAINMGGNRINGVLAPVTGTDAANKDYVDAQNTTNLSLTGGTMTGALNMGTKAISNAAAVALNGTSSSDALTLSKAAGGAAYALALPAAAPAANTYLQYTGSAYTWSAAAGGGIGATKLGLGMTGETWHDVTSQRIPTTAPQPSPTYINNRTYPIMVTIGYVPTDISDSCIEMYTSTNGYNNDPNMMIARTTGGNLNSLTTLSTIILPNERYWPGVFGGTYTSWIELY